MSAERSNQRSNGKANRHSRSEQMNGDEMIEHVSNPDELPVTAGSELSDGLGGPGGQIVCPSELRIEALEKLCKRYYEALVIDLGNVRSLKAASPGIKTFDVWESELVKVVDHHPSRVSHER